MLREREREREIGSMGLTTALLTLLSICTVTARAFNCNGSSGTTCNGLVGYISANTTTLSNITTMFGIPDFRYLLGANNFLLSTPPNQTVSAKQVIKIPFTCHCTNNGTGIPLNRRPIYKVVAGDGLYHIACGGDRGGVVEVVSGDEFRCAGGVVDGLANDVEAEFGEREFARSQGLRMANDLQVLLLDSFFGLVCFFRFGSCCIALLWMKNKGQK